MGILLVEPARWHKLHTSVHPEDFADDRRRRLAEIYWHHQQDVGEPVFAEFLAELEDPNLKELAVELVEQAEHLPTGGADGIITGFVSYLEEQRRETQLQKQVAGFRRISPQSDGAEDEAARLAELVKNIQAMGQRRIVPRRFSSGS